MKQFGKILPKNQEDLIELARQQDWHVSKTMSGHWRLVNRRGQIVVASGTPSDANAVLDLRARLKRYGLKPGVIKVRKAPPPEPKLVKEKIVETEPEATIVTAEPVKAKKKRNVTKGVRGGVLRSAMLEVMGRMDSVHGLSVHDVLPEVVKKLGIEITAHSLSSSMRYYPEIMKIGHGRYRLKTLATAQQPAPTPAPAPEPAEEDDAKFLDQALVVLDRLERIVKKHKAIAEMLGNLGGTKR